MRKAMVWVFSVVLLVTFFGMTEVAHAASQSWQDWGKRMNVQTDKVWTIQLNTPVKPESVNKDQVYVENSSSGERHAVTLQQTEDKKAIRVVPSQDYTVGQTYTLYVKQGLRSEQGNKPMEFSVKKSFNVSRDYQIAKMSGKDSYTYGRSFDTFAEAKADALQDGSEVIFYRNEVVWIPEGLARTKKFTILYADKNLNSSVTYVNSDAELEYIGSEGGNSLKVRLAGEVLYVKPTDVYLLPPQFIDGQSYYTNQNGELVHHLFYNGYYVSYTYGDAPESMAEGEKVYTPDGIVHLNDTDTPMFNQLSLKTKTDYTAEDIDQYIKEKAPNSPLVGQGEAFMKAQEKYGVNALYLMAHAIHESAWGLSRIAQDKNNFFGLNASDDNPYVNADKFISVEANILYAAQFVSQNYLGEIGTDYRSNGDYLGNKAEGMNVKYASDPYWGQKIAGHMYRADNWLGNKDRNLLTGEPDPVADAGEKEEPQAGEKDFSDKEEGTTDVETSSESN